MAEKAEIETIALANYEKEELAISQRGIADSILSNLKELGHLRSEKISLKNLVDAFSEAQGIYSKLEREGMETIEQIERDRELEHQSSVKVVRLYEVELKKEKQPIQVYSPVKSKLSEDDWINRLLHILYNEWTQSQTFERTWLKMMKVVYNRNRSWFLAPFEPVGAVFREKAIRVSNFRVVETQKNESLKLELDAKFDEGYCIALTSGLKIKLPLMNELIVPLFVHLTVTDFTGTIIVSLNRKKKQECWYCLKPGSQLLFEMKTFLGESCKIPLDILPQINSRVVQFNRAKVQKYIYPNTKPITIPFIF